MQRNQIKPAEQKTESVKEETRQEQQHSRSVQQVLGAWIARNLSKDAAGAFRMDRHFASSVGNAGLSALLDAQTLPQEHIPTDYPDDAEPAQIDAADLPNEEIPEMEEL